MYQPAVSKTLRKLSSKFQLTSPLPVSHKALESPYLSEPPSPPPQVIRETSSIQNGLRWRGSAGADFYIFERCIGSEAGPWVIVGECVRDCVGYGKAVFKDGDVDVDSELRRVLERGGEVWYRIVAVNEFGKSQPSMEVRLT
jgi:hypothetical protein